MSNRESFAQALECFADPQRRNEYFHLYPIYPRINNSTCGSKKGTEQIFDLLGIMSDVIEVSEERVAKILRLFKETIVCDVLASVIPDAFCRIQLRPVGGKLEHSAVATVGFEPVVGFLFLVIRGVVLNQVYTGRARVEGGPPLLSREAEWVFT